MNNETAKLSGYEQLCLSVIKFLSKDDDLDKPYLITKDSKTWTKRQLVVEIENKTDVGVGLVNNLVILALDMFDRQKQPLTDYSRTNE